jgi:hypothetical protein
MGRRGPKPSSKFAKKGATLGLRVTVETRRRLEAAAKASGLSLSREAESRLARSFGLEAEDQLIEIVRMAIENTDRATGQCWLHDPYTFDMMVEVIGELLRTLRPEGEVRTPETFQLVRFDPALDRIPQLQRRIEELRATFASWPPEAWARSIAGGIIIAVQQRGFGRDARERAIFERLDKIRDLVSDPILKGVGTDVPEPEEKQS